MATSAEPMRHDGKSAISSVATISKCSRIGPQWLKAAAREVQLLLSSGTRRSTGELGEPTLQAHQVPCLTFPHGQDAPSSPSERGDGSSISRDVAFSFCAPELCVGSGHDATVPAVMHVPKATVYEDHRPQGRQNNVRPARKLAAVQTKSVAHPVKQGAHDAFRCGVPIADPRHAATSLLTGKNVGH